MSGAEGQYLRCWLLRIYTPTAGLVAWMFERTRPRRLWYEARAWWRDQ